MQYKYTIVLTIVPALLLSEIGHVENYFKEHTRQKKFATYIPTPPEMVMATATGSGTLHFVCGTMKQRP